GRQMRALLEVYAGCRRASQIPHHLCSMRRGPEGRLALNMPYRLIPFGIALGIFILDRITKNVIKSHISAWETLRVIPGFFNIVHAENPGVAFGLLADSTSAWRNVFLIGLSVTVLVFISSLLWI